MKTILLCLALTLLAAGCNKPASKTDAPAETSNTPAQTTAPAPSPEPVAPPAAPLAGMKTCFNCAGAGITACATCKGTGMAECPGQCIRLNRGAWKHMNVPNHPATDLWLQFPDGAAWNQNHAGDVVQMKNGHAVNLGRCPTCGGSTKVKCAACQTTGKHVCSICEGKKVVPEAWTAFNNPKLKDPPGTIELSDGTKLVGKIVARTSDEATVRVEGGKFIKVPLNQIVSDGSSKAP